MSESKVLGATFDSLDALDSDPGPNPMSLMNRPRAPGLQIQVPPTGPSGASESSASNAESESNESKEGPKVRTLERVDSSKSAPGPNLMNRMDLRPGLEMH